MEDNCCLNQDEQFFNVILNAIKNDEVHNEYLDPIYLTVMKDPVVLSTGVVMDRSTVFADNGELKFKECPLTMKELKAKAYPVNALKAKIIDWTKNRFKVALELAKTYKQNRDLAIKASDYAKVLLLDLGEDIYKYQAS